jgi:chromate transporter
MAVIALMQRELVEKRALFTSDEFLHGVGLGQILGSFAVNAAFFSGYRLFGLAGGILCVAAFMLPSLVLVIALSHFYFLYHEIPALEGAVAGLGPVVIALIVDAAVSFGRQTLRTPAAIVVGVAALAAGVLKTNAAWVILVAGGIGLVLPVGRRPRDERRAAALPAIIPAAHMPAALGPLSMLSTIALTFFKTGLVFFGGGFALIPVLHHRLVTEFRWLSPREFLDGVAISSLTPGPIAVLATFAGYHVGGIPGALIATVALLAPAAALMWLLSGQYEKHRHDVRAQRFLAGVNPAVTGLILSAAVLLGSGAIASWRGGAIAVVAWVLLGRYRWYPAIVLALGAAAGYIGLLP